MHSVVWSQLIPISDDIGRLVSHNDLRYANIHLIRHGWPVQERFRELACVFFQEKTPSLNDAQLFSTENGLLLSMFWRDRLDRGGLFFRCIENEVRSA